MEQCIYFPYTTATVKKLIKVKANQECQTRT
jgi:hypothetical protein